ncbi:MAG: TolB family protein, partial [Planctomycetota bacterium]
MSNRNPGLFQRLPLRGLSFLGFSVWGVFLLAATLPCQRQVRQITKLEEPHFDCQISPDGKMVAFRGKGNKIAVVDVGGNKETDLVTGTSLGNFVWAPNNAGIYFMDGSNVKFVSKSGG